jgi:hypothetical protein
MRSRDPIHGQTVGDLGKRPAARVLKTDPRDNRLGEYRSTSSQTSRRPRTADLHVGGQKRLKLSNRDQPLTPRRLHRIDQRDNAPVDRGNADAEGVGRLLAAVGKSLDLFDLSQFTGWHPSALLPDVLMPQLSFAAPLPFAAHEERTVIDASDSTYGASVSPWLSR